MTLWLIALFFFALPTFAIIDFRFDILLFYAAIRRPSVTLLRFLFRSHVHVFLCAISPACHPFSCFSSHLCFLVFVFRPGLILPQLQLACVIGFLKLFKIQSSSPIINVSTQYLMLASPLSPFLDTYSLSLSSGCNAMCIDIFSCPLVNLSHPVVHCKNGPEYVRRRTTPVLILLIRFPQLSLISNIFVLLRYSFLILSFISACLMVSASNIRKYL